MRKNSFLILILSVIILGMFSGLSAEKLGLDVNGTPIQSARYFTAVKDSIPAQASAVYDSTAVPSNANETTVIFRHQAGYVYFGAAKTLTAEAADWTYIPKDTPVTFPTQYGITYVKYKACTGAASINLIFRRM